MTPKAPFFSFSEAKLLCVSGQQNFGIHIVGLELPTHVQRTKNGEGFVGW